MKKIISIWAYATAIYFVYGCGDNATNHNRKQESAIVGDSTSIDGNKIAAKTGLLLADSTFVMQAALSGMAEVEFGKLALKNGKHSRIKEFAAMMVTDHTKANAELHEVAKSYGIPLPTVLDDKHQSKYDMLKAKAGDDFDNAYAAVMIDGHKTTSNHMEQGKSKLKNEQLKGFAEKTAPIVLHHLELINTIASEIK